jgi:hypothetical protein
MNELLFGSDISCHLMFMYTYNNMLLGLTAICWLFTILVRLLIALWLVSLLSIVLGNWLVPRWLTASLWRLAITLVLLLSK